MIIVVSVIHIAIHLNPAPIAAKVMITEHKIYNATQAEWRITSQFSRVFRLTVHDPTLPLDRLTDTLLELKHDRAAIRRAVYKEVE